MAAIPDNDSPWAEMAFQSSFNKQKVFKKWVSKQRLTFLYVLASDEIEGALYQHKQDKTHTTPTSTELLPPTNSVEIRNLKMTPLETLYQHILSGISVRAGLPQPSGSFAVPLITAK